MHSIKKHMWFLETAAALLEGDDYTERELMQAMSLSMAKTSPDDGSTPGSEALKMADWEPALEMDVDRRRSVVWESERRAQ